MRLVIVAVTLLIAGCTEYIREPILRDPTWLRVALYNDSPYRANLEGAFTGSIEPHSVIYKNMECRGRFEGVAHAYKEIGRTASGSFVEKAYMGERIFRFSVDGRNQIYNSESVDAYIILSEGSFRVYPNVLGEKTHYVAYLPCSFLAPDISIEKGR